MLRKRVVGKGIPQNDLAVFVPLNQQVGGGHGVRTRVMVLPEDLHRSLVVVRPNPVLRFREHPARPAGWIADRDDDAVLGEHARIGLQQQVHHQLNDFTWREVITGGFVRRFVEPANQIFEHQPHGDVVDLGRVQIDFRKLGHHPIEPVGLFELVDFLAELEADILREAGDVIGQVPSDVVGIALEFMEVKLAVIMKAERGSVPSLAG